MFFQDVVVLGGQAFLPIKLMNDYFYIVNGRQKKAWSIYLTRFYDQ